MRVIVTEGILYGETHWKVTDKVSLLLCFFEEYFFFFFFNLDTLDFFLFRKQQVGFLQIQIGVSCSFQN